MNAFLPSPSTVDISSFGVPASGSQESRTIYPGDSPAGRLNIWPQTRRRMAAKREGEREAEFIMLIYSLLLTRKPVKQASS